MELLRVLLALQGALILFLSLVGGVYYAKAITAGKGEVAWRVVHSGGSMAGVMLLAFIPVLPLLALPSWGLHCFAWSFSVGTWLLVIGMIIAASTSQRGLDRSDAVWNLVVRRLYGVGSIFSFVGAIFLVAGLVLAL